MSGLVAHGAECVLIAPKTGLCGLASIVVRREIEAQGTPVICWQISAAALPAAIL